MVQGANSYSSDPSIPPGFETHNRFQGIGEDQEVSSKITDTSITKPVVSEPFQAANIKVRKKKRCSSKSLTSPSKISAGNLMKFGSTMGSIFPSTKANRQEMFSGVAKSHKGFTMEEVDENPT